MSVIWLTGIPASGKTTTARALVAALRARGEAVIHFDSDDLREHVFTSLGYESDDRERFYTGLGHLVGLASVGGSTVVVSATAARRVFRDRVRAAVPRFVEVWLDAPLELAAARDPKGLYARAAAGEAPDMPAVGACYEEPLAPELHLEAGQPTAVQVDAILRRLETVPSH